jgi:hypothetical protein
MRTNGEKQLHDCSGPLSVYHQISGCRMVVWPVWWAIKESDESDHLKSSTNQGGLGWLRRVTVYSHVGTGDFREGVPLVDQWDHKQFAYNAKIRADSVVEASNS